MEIQGGGANMIWTDLLGAVGKGLLPGDLMVEILGRLPVDSILRFKSVCRAWYALFMSPIFVQHHFQVAGSAAVMNKLTSLIVHTRSREGNDQILSLLLDESYGNPIMKSIDCPPFEGYSDEIQVVGSINGLVCLSLGSHATFIVIWNPATREYLQIPKPLLLLGSEERVSLGFAYDKKSESYKVIRILYSKHFTALMRAARVEIYSTRTNAWRTMAVVGFPWLCFQKTCNTLVGGVPYWYAVELQEQGIFRELMTWFDAAEDIFRYHSLPCYHDLSGFRMRLGVMGELPVVIVYSIEMQQNGRVEIWELNKRSDCGKDVLFWKKKLTVEPVYGLERVIGCWRNGEIIAENKQGAVFIHDPHPNQIKDLPSCGTSGFVEVYGYTESLVSPSRLA